jgi:IclR family transcriptional regulator, KDG regulon repressor
MLGTVYRAGDLLELFDPQTPEWGATAVSQRLQITKSQAHQMLVSLEAIGLLRRAGRGRFRLGWKTVTLSQRLLRSEFTVDDARILRELAEQVKVSVDLITRDGNQYVRIGGYGPSNHSIDSDHASGMPCAAGKVLLSGMTTAKLREHMPHHELDVELMTVRKRGIAFGTDKDRRTVAAPVHDRDGEILAAVAVAVTHEDWAIRGEQLTRAVAGVAQRISRNLRNHEEVGVAESATHAADQVHRPRRARISAHVSRTPNIA